MNDPITPIINEVIKEHDKDPYDINNGQCGTFAKIVMERLQEQDIEIERPVENYVIEDCLEKSYTSHRWIYVPMTGKNYDAECPQGVENALDLPIFQRINDVWSEKEIIHNRFTTE